MTNLLFHSNVTLLRKLNLLKWKNFQTTIFSKKETVHAKAFTELSKLSS